LDAIYQTVTTITTVGFREVRPLTDTGKAFTIFVCGWGRVGHALGREVAAADADLVVVDVDQARLEDAPFPWVLGDATDDAVLERAGLARARALVAALDG